MRRARGIGRAHSVRVHRDRRARALVVPYRRRADARYRNAHRADDKTGTRRIRKIISVAAGARSAAIFLRAQAGKLMKTALYRKYRPSTFDGVIGQDVIVRTLGDHRVTAHRTKFKQRRFDNLHRLYLSRG